MSEDAAPTGIPGSPLTGPWPVGQYAAGLRERLRELARVQIFGEVFNVRVGRVRVWFELRDERGALPCSMWRQDFEALPAPLADGQRVVVAGGCDYYPGSRAASPSFSFAVAELRIAGEGDLLAQLAQLRRALGAEGPFAPVQDRHAAPAVTRALQDLAACPEVEVVIVARGGGSLADLFAFCDETLCRTVAMLRVPVVASVGHHTDRTLIDDVAAVSCSTPTHAAEAAVPVHCRAARAELHELAARLGIHGERALL